MNIKPVEIQKAYRLFNIGATTMVSAKSDSTENVMSAAWVMPVDFDQLILILSSESYTRQLIEKSGRFAVQIPVAAQAELVLQLGSESKRDNPHKIDGVPLFYQEGYEVPLVQGCAAWVVCELTGEASNREQYDLLMGKIVAAWSDERVFRNGHWEFDDAPDSMRTLHYVAGGQFYTIGKGLNVN